MASALDTLERIATSDASNASPEWVFNDPNERGLRTNPRTAAVAYKRRLAEVAGLMANVKRGRDPIKSEYLLREAMTTSDFSTYFGDILDRQLLANWRETPTTYQDWCKVRTVKDFRTVRSYYSDGAQGVLSAVPEQDEYPAAALTVNKYDYTVGKFGRVVPISWEAVINDDLGIFDDLPQRLGRAARYTVEKFATGLIAGTTGFNTALFTSGNGNIVTSNPVLSISALQTAFTKLAAQRDTDGNPIVITMAYLLVPPALEVTAMNIVNATEIFAGGLGQTGGGGVAAQGLRTANWMRSKVQLRVLPFLPVVASSSNGDTTWFLVAGPDAGRPVAEIGFLRGHEEPEVTMKSPNQVVIGGRNVDPMFGSFENDTVAYRVREVHGGAVMFPQSAVASSGAGS